MKRSVLAIYGNPYKSCREKKRLWMDPLSIRTTMGQCKQCALLSDQTDLHLLFGDIFCSDHKSESPGQVQISTWAFPSIYAPKNLLSMTYAHLIGLIDT